MEAGQNPSFIFVKITLQHEVEEKRINNKEFEKLKEKVMWDLGKL